MAVLICRFHTQYSPSARRTTIWILTTNWQKYYNKTKTIPFDANTKQSILYALSITTNNIVQREKTSYVSTLCKLKKITFIYSICIAIRLVGDRIAWCFPFFSLFPFLLLEGLFSFYLSHSTLHTLIIWRMSFFTTKYKINFVAFFVLFLFIFLIIFLWMVHMKWSLFLYRFYSKRCGLITNRFWL